jgi:hypothetical protein
LVLLAGIFAHPYLDSSPSMGDELTRNTVRLSLLYYAAAVALMIWLRPTDGTAQSRRGAMARWLWTLAWAALVIHVGIAFHYVHRWLHGAAVEHTRQVSGLGEGVYVSYLFTLVWTADVLCWWLAPARYAARPVWMNIALHTFMIFMIFNATVVFESGWIRWAGIAMLSGLAVLWFLRRAVAGDRG